jgi:hypothetical protein
LVYLYYSKGAQCVKEGVQSNLFSLFSYLRTSLSSVCLSSWQALKSCNALTFVLLQITVNFDGFFKSALLEIKTLYLVFILVLYEWSILLSVIFNLNSSFVPH